MGLVVRYNFVASLVSTSHVKTSALVRDQLQVWLHHDGVKVLYTTVVLRNKGNEIVSVTSKFPAIRKDQKINTARNIFLFLIVIDLSFYLRIRELANRRPNDVKCSKR